MARTASNNLEFLAKALATITALQMLGVAGRHVLAIVVEKGHPSVGLLPFEHLTFTDPMGAANHPATVVGVRQVLSVRLQRDLSVADFLDGEALRTTRLNILCQISVYTLQCCAGNRLPRGMRL